MRDDLIHDSEQLPAIGPVRPTPEHLRRLERKQLVVEYIGEDGSVRPEVLEGDTRAGWAVRERKVEARDPSPGLPASPGKPLQREG